MITIDRNIYVKQFDRHKTYVHYAQIIKGNKVLASAFNKVKDCPEAGSLHAERSVVKALGDINLLKGTTLVVIRMTKNSEELKNSKPCKHCQGFLKACMKKYGLKKVIYS
jgi:hypothetical protein